ncbi:MAG: DUF4386 domain-containing protein [Cyclobacteriaceae bacterium]|nr:DUF4386 domain-containing protein [Cyclobacteriaceae bacterium]
MTTMNFPTSKSYTRIAGVLYLLIALLGFFSIGYAPTVLFVPGDALANAQSILNHQGLFRITLFSDILIIIIEMVLTVMLYHMFKAVNNTVAKVALYSRLAMSFIMAINLINYLIPLHLLNGANYVKDMEHAQSLALLFLDAHQDGVLIWGLFFGLHLTALGYMVYRSGYVPKVLGVLLLLGSFGYTIESVSTFTLPDSLLLSYLSMGLLGFAVIGELSFAIWLMTRKRNSIGIL